MSLPDGFNTPVGTRGNRVSGGQRQRLAIAKALLRKPKILSVHRPFPLYPYFFHTQTHRGSIDRLLDEATSSLDSSSEIQVQNALSSASHGRTTIAVAHHLSSIAHADRIYTFHPGRMVESGTHDELIGRRGRYFELVALQDLGH